MSKQTIDGVPRELRALLERVVGKASQTPHWDALDEDRIAAAAELRALLDAPAKAAPAGCDSFQMSGAVLHCNGGENPITHTLNGVVVNLDGWTLYAPDSPPVDRPYTTLTKCGDDWATSHRISKGPTFLVEKGNWVEDGAKLAKTCDGQTVRIGRDGGVELVQGKPTKPYGYMFHPDGKKDEEFFIYDAPKERVPDHRGECWTATPLYTEQPAPVAVVLPSRDQLRDIIAQAIGADTYDCVRVWDAWGVGTMSQDDFIPVVEQEERLYEIADACLDEVTRLNTK